jgi:hypothetical protein
MLARNYFSSAPWTESRRIPSGAYADHGGVIRLFVMMRLLTASVRIAVAAVFTVGMFRAPVFHDVPGRRLP